MKARPGSSSMTDADRRWVRGLHAHFAKAPYALRPLFFATDASFGMVPLDELIATAS